MTKSRLSRQRTLPVWTAETLYVFMALVDSRTGDLELSLELYHRRELQLGYQQSITEILLWRTQTSG